jgi:hypothetical protein
MSEPGMPGGARFFLAPKRNVLRGERYRGNGNNEGKKISKYGKGQYGFQDYTG